MKKTGAKRKKKNSTAGKLMLAVTTCLNITLSLLLHLLHRREVLHAVEANDDVKLLLTSTKKESSERAKKETV